MGRHPFKYFYIDVVSFILDEEKQVRTAISDQVPGSDKEKLIKFIEWVKAVDPSIRVADSLPRNLSNNGGDAKAAAAIWYHFHCDPEMSDEAYAVDMTAFGDGESFEKAIGYPVIPREVVDARWHLGEMPGEWGEWLDQKRWQLGLSDRQAPVLGGSVAVFLDVFLSVDSLPDDSDYGFQKASIHLTPLGAEYATIEHNKTYKNKTRLNDHVDFYLDGAGQTKFWIIHAKSGILNGSYEIEPDEIFLITPTKHEVEFHVEMIVRTRDFATAEGAVLRKDAKEIARRSLLARASGD